MQSIVTNTKYINVVFSWTVKNNDALVQNETGKLSTICIKGYWQGIIDVENFRLFSIEDFDYPLGSRKKVFNSGIHTLLESNSKPKYVCLENTYISSIKPPVGDNIIYIGIGKDGVIADYISDSEDYILCETDTALEHQKFKRLYESVISTNEVVNVVENANMIEKAVKIMLEYQQNSRDDSGELCFMNILRKTLNSKTPIQIQSMLLRDVLEDSYITYEELLELGFSYEII